MITQEVPIRSIVVLENTRTRIGESDLSGLMASIQQHGLIHPPSVWKKKDRYILAQGHRRLESCKKLGWTKIPVTIIPRVMSDEQFLSFNTAENVHREDISPANFALTCAKLKALGYNVTEIATKLAVPKSKVDTGLKIYAQVPDKYKKELEYRPAGHVSKGGIPASVANKIITLRISMKEKSDLLAIAKQEELSINEIELIGRLVASGCTVKQAIKLKDKYETKVVTLVVRKKELARLDETFKSYVRKILKGQESPNENLIY